MLKDRGVEVYFEKENIYTLDSQGELLITIMSSLALEESRSISENVTWGKRKRCRMARFHCRISNSSAIAKAPMGCRRSCPRMAVIVKDIYCMFLEGKSPSFIARFLSERGIPSPGGKSNWRPNTIISILTNEK